MVNYFRGESDIKPIIRPPLTFKFYPSDEVRCGGRIPGSTVPLPFSFHLQISDISWILINLDFNEIIQISDTHCCSSQRNLD